LFDSIRSLDYEKNFKEKSELFHTFLLFSFIYANGILENKAKKLNSALSFKLTVGQFLKGLFMLLQLGSMAETQTKISKN